MRDAQMMLNAVGGQTITVSAASTNTIDLADLLHQIGQTSQKIKVRVQVVGTFSTLTSLDVAFQDSSDNSTFTDSALKIPTILAAKLVAGAMIIDIDIPQAGSGAAQVNSGALGIPPGPNAIRRYVRMNYTVNGSNAGAGSIIDAWLDVY